MNLFRKKIKFYCSLPEVKERYPIISARSQKFQWLRNSAVAYKRMVDERSTQEQISGTVKCGGIASIMQHGYVVRSWFDITIKPLDDSKNFECYIPEGIYAYLNEKNYNKKLVTWFSNDNPSHGIPLAPTDLQSLIKINTPWTVSIPKGWNLLFMPIPYSDNPEFSATHGVLETGNKYDISVIIKIHTTNKELFIPAGTPLCQFIPFQTDAVPIEFFDITEEMKKLNTQYQYDRNHSFIIKYK
jgi:hypothetical protein